VERVQNIERSMVDPVGNASPTACRGQAYPSRRRVVAVGYCTTMWFVIAAACNGRTDLQQLPSRRIVLLA